MTWRTFAAAAPEMAELGQAQFAAAGVALVGTVRRDGSPRISRVEPCVIEGELYLGMMWQSRKALDLLRDPRIVVCNAICSNTGTERELTLRGRGIAIADPAVRRRFMEAVAERSDWKEPFHLFAVAVESAALLTYQGGEQAVQLWPQGVAFKRPY
jgi:hypothetical protein